MNVVGLLDIPIITRYNSSMHENIEPQKLIAASPLFRNLQPREAEAVLARLQPSSAGRGTHILERGVWHGRLYIIASGQVSVLLQEHGEREPVIIAHLGPGECFGEMSFITGEPPTATIRAEQDTLLWSLPQADFLQLVASCPTLLRNINTILSQRLARTNQHLLSRQSGELIWLPLVDAHDTPIRRSLALYIADALAERFHRRVLLLELAGQDQSIAARLATEPGQMRPGLLDIAADRSLMQAHAAPTLSDDGRWYAALATLAPTEEQLQALDAGSLALLHDLAPHYDYLLLVTTEKTPSHLVQALAKECQRAITCVSADSLTMFASSLQEAISERAVFVTHVPERPTIGAQDRYAGQLGCAVTRLLPADMPLLEACWEERKTPRQLAPTTQLTGAIDFVARYLARRTVGIAFGGGGARGFAHLGVLERLLHYGVPLDYIAACSSGIIAPGMYLLGKSIAESEAMFLEIQRHIVQWTIPRTSIFSNRGLKRMMRELCGDVYFEDLTTPYALVAVDLATRAGVVLDRGPLWQAGLASVSLPGIFPPVIIGKHVLMDAGIHDPVPIRLVRRMGAHVLLASELGEQGPPTLENASSWLAETQQPGYKFASEGEQKMPRIVDILLRSYDLAMATIGMHSIREADVVIRPKLHRVSLRQFSEGRKFIAAGREAVEQSLPDLRKHLPWL